MSIFPYFRNIKPSRHAIYNFMHITKELNMEIRIVNKMLE